MWMIEKLEYFYEMLKFLSRIKVQNYVYQRCYFAKYKFNVTLGTLLPSVGCLLLAFGRFWATSRINLVIGSIGNRFL